MIEEVIGHAETLTPIALIGGGGIGKTAIALTVLHHDRIKKQFGDNRWFIRCDQFPTSCGHFLSQLSKVIGAGVENPEDLTPLRPFLSSRKMILILDNAESVLDPQGMNAQKIYAIVEELVQFKNMCICITSRISIVPPHCKRPIIPKLSMESACDIFYAICNNGSRSDVISDLLRQLDFHPLSITLLATTASQHVWNYNRLAKEWHTHHVQVLHTNFNGSLAATIEVSLTSPMFENLGPNGRDLLGVVAFYPQGINEENLSWLFPTIPNIRGIFDTFCILSLTYQGNGFITMLAPLRDYLCPQDPALSPSLCMTKECYFSRLSVEVSPDKPGFEEAKWIAMEDVNVEHLLNVFTTVDKDSTNVWSACSKFMEHLFWHKGRLVVLGQKVEQLADDNPSKPQCLLSLSRLFESVGNREECKRILVSTLELWRKQGDGLGVARVLRFLSDANRRLGLHEEGVQQAKEALGIYKQFDDKLGQAKVWHRLAWLFFDKEELTAAEEAASKAIEVCPAEGGQFLVCQCHRVLGKINGSRGKMKSAIGHFTEALSIASVLNWHEERFWAHHSLAELFSDHGRLSDADAHIKHAKLYATNDTYNMGRAMMMQALIWSGECRLEEAKVELLHAVDMLEKLGDPRELRICRRVLQMIEEAMNEKGKPSETLLPPTPVSAQGGAGVPLCSTQKKHAHVLV